MRLFRQNILGMPHSQIQNKSRARLAQKLGGAINNGLLFGGNAYSNNVGSCAHSGILPDSGDVKT